MKLFNVLLLSISFLFFASAAPVHSYESYKVISVSKFALKTEFYKVKGNEFAFHKDLYVTFNQFNSLTDFRANVMYQGKSHWASYEMSIVSDPSLGCDEVQGGSFGINDAGGRHSGNLVIGKSLSQEALKKLQECRELSFEGTSSFSGSPISLKIDAVSGIINGTIGEFSVESSPKDFDGTFQATIYSLGEDGTKTNKGGILVSIYGEDTYVLAGAYLVLFGKSFDLIFLQQVK